MITGMRFPSGPDKTTRHGRYCHPLHRNLVRTAAVFIAIVTVAAVTGCSARQEIVLDSDGAGVATIEIRLDPVFAAYLTDLSAGLGAEDDAPLFETDAITEAFDQRPGLELQELSVPSREELHLTVAFNSVEQILALEGGSLTRFLRFERTEQFRRVAADIDRRAIEHFTGLTGVDPVVLESLLPPEPDMTRSAYQDHLAWALEEYARERSLDTVFDESRIVTDISPSGRIVRVQGGTVRSGRAVFTTPLVDAAITPRPLEYSLVFVP